MSKVKTENLNAFCEKRLNFPDYKYPNYPRQPKYPKYPNYPNYPKYGHGRKEDMNEQS